VGYTANRLHERAKLITNGLEDWRMRLIGPRMPHGMSDVKEILCRDQENFAL
jgi:hypothetical protein